MLTSRPRFGDDSGVRGPGVAYLIDGGPGRDRRGLDRGTAGGGLVDLGGGNGPSGEVGEDLPISGRTAATAGDHDATAGADPGGVHRLLAPHQREQHTVVGSTGEV